MGLSSKHVSGDQPLDWGQTFHQPAAAEPPKPPPARRQPPPQQAETLKCPRCSSTNTKFCYYNNYNKSQPRHFCKSCKRHWTKGGTLRNVPVGGGRKNKRPKLSKPAAGAAAPAGGGGALSIRDFSSFSQKNMSSIFLQTGSAAAEAAGVTAAPQRSVQNTEFQFSGLSTFDVNSSVYDHQPFDQFAGNLDAAEESTVTTVNMAGSSVGAWDLPSYWNWSDIDVLTSGDLSVTWDDQDNAVIKP